MAFLLVMAGCNGLGVGETDTGPSQNGDTTATPTQTATPTPVPTPDPKAVDLRQIEVNTWQLESTEPVDGQVDRNDPKDDNGYYEPVVFAGEANETYTIEMDPKGEGDPRLELRAPNGTILDVTTTSDAEYNNDAVIENITLAETGQYTIRASSASNNPNATLEYDLVVKQIPTEGQIERSKEGWGAGDPAYWNTSERYANWANDYGNLAEGKFDTTDVEKPVMVNPENDYAVITLIGGPQLNSTERQWNIGALALAYSDLYEYYKENDVVNSSWAPERMYYRFITPEDRELYRINSMSLEGAKQVEDDEIGPLIDEYFVSTMYGPANDIYEPGANNAAESLSEYPGLNRTGEVRAPPNPRVENTTSR